MAHVSSTCEFLCRLCSLSQFLLFVKELQTGKAHDIRGKLVSFDSVLYYSVAIVMSSYLDQ